jgi:hypothetical protein
LVGALALPGSTLSGPAPGFDDSACEVTSISFSVNETRTPLVAVRRGDHVVVTFDVPMGCVNRMTFSSFVAPAPAFDGSRLHEQALYSQESGTFGSGRHSMAVDVFDFPGSKIADCPAVPAPTPVISQLPDDHAKVTFEHGANQSGPYDSTCDGSPSQNGNGNSGKGKPCAGCVGSADDKNPPGQRSGGNDHNAGYECDRNKGVGQGNPAHSGCKNFQVDFSYHPISGDERSLHGHSRELIAAVFCVRASQVCYTTDRTDSGAVLRA